MRELLSKPWYNFFNPRGTHKIPQDQRLATSQSPTCGPPAGGTPADRQPATGQPPAGRRLAAGRPPAGELGERSEESELESEQRLFLVCEPTEHKLKHV